MKKNRQINPLEQHFEKLVLGVVSLVLLAVVAMQFLTQPNAVKVGNSPPVPPDQVFDTVRSEADQLIAQMRSVSPTLPEVEAQDVSTRFQEVAGLAAADSVSLTRIASGVPLGTGAGETATVEAVTTYAMPAPPVPAGIVAATHRAAVDPFVWAADQELRRYLPPQQPFDVVAVSIEGTVSGQSLRESLEKDPDGDEGPIRQLPLNWWRGNVDLLGVEVQREELGPDGAWAGATIVSGMPGTSPVLKEARRTGITPIDLQRVSDQAAMMAREVAQPAFPPTIAGPEWVRPSESKDEAGLSEDDLRKSRLKRRVDELDRRIAAREQQLQDVGAGSDPGGQLERRGGGGRTGGGEGGRTTRPTTTGSDRDAAERERIQREIEAYQRQRQQAVDELATLGVVLDEDPSRAAAGRGEPERPLPDIMAAADLPVWVHDLGAEPGKTYRYRMRAVLNNPLFGRAQFLAEPQQDAAASPVLEGEWSEWSAPVAVEADQHFFVVSASQDDSFGNPPRAAVEVYEFYYGYWRRASTTLEPGDTVQARAKLPDSLVIYDPAKLEELAAQPTRGRDPRSDPGREGGGGRVIEPQQDERSLRELRGTPPAPSRGAGAQAAGEQLPEGAAKVEPWLDLAVPAMLLDVARLPGTRDAFQAVLRSPEGTITVRNAEQEKSADLYRRLAASAREGETQGQPAPDPNANRPVQPDRRRQEYPQEDEGGGGGGG